MNPSRPGNRCFRMTFSILRGTGKKRGLAMTFACLLSDVPFWSLNHHACHCQGVGSPTSSHMWLLLQSHRLLHQDSHALETIGGHQSPTAYFTPAGRHREHHASRCTCGFLSLSLNLAQCTRGLIIRTRTQSLTRRSSSRVSSTSPTIRL